MSSTNKTEHYNLPQFIGSDIPTWLGDFNSAMTAIDSGINAAATSASGAATDAATAQKSATDAANDAAAAQKTANDALKAANRCPFPIGYGGFFQTDPNSIYEGTTWEQKKDVFILASGDTYGAGSTGGEAQHKLTIDEMPNHRHLPYADGNSTNPDFKLLMGSDTEYKDSAGTSRYRVQTSNYVKGFEAYTNSVGGSQPHNNMPPYYSMPFWIRTA